MLDEIHRLRQIEDRLSVRIAVLEHHAAEGPKGGSVRVVPLPSPAEPPDLEPASPADWHGLTSCDLGDGRTVAIELRGDVDIPESAGAGGWQCRCGRPFAVRLLPVPVEAGK